MASLGRLFGAYFPLARGYSLIGGAISAYAFHGGTQKSLNDQECKKTYTYDGKFSLSNNEYEASPGKGDNLSSVSPVIAGFLNGILYAGGLLETTTRLSFEIFIQGKQ